MASGTGISNTGLVLPASGSGGGMSTNILGSSYGNQTPSSLGGNTAIYESKMSGPIWKGGKIIMDSKPIGPWKGGRRRRGRRQSRRRRDIDGGSRRRRRRTKRRI